MTKTRIGFDTRWLRAALSAGLLGACSPTLIEPLERQDGGGGGTTAEPDAGAGGAAPICYECACGRTSTDVHPGCADVCTQTPANDSPSYCDGHAALAQCHACIVDTCGAQSKACANPGGTGFCFDCACGRALAKGGCRDLCDMNEDGEPGTPDLCNGGAANPACQECVLSRCNTPDPILCTGKLPPCHHCACALPFEYGGCANLCADFCGGAAPSQECQSCILAACGEGDPAACM